MLSVCHKGCNKVSWWRLILSSAGWCVQPPLGLCLIIHLPIGWMWVNTLLSLLNAHIGSAYRHLMMIIHPESETTCSSISAVLLSAAVCWTHWQAALCAAALLKQSHNPKYRRGGARQTVSKKALRIIHMIQLHHYYSIISGTWDGTSFKTTSKQVKRK